MWSYSVESLTLVYEDGSAGFCLQGIGSDFYAEAKADTGQDRQFIAVIGDEEYVLLEQNVPKADIRYSSVTGLLLAGVGHVTEPPDAQRNFLVVDSKTEKPQIEDAFNKFTKERKDIGIVLINQHVCSWSGLEDRSSSETSRAQG